MINKIGFLKSRDANDILIDVCNSFNIDYDDFVSRRNNKKSTEIDSLICQAFILIMRNCSLLSLEDIGKYLNRSKAQVCIYNKKANNLYKSNHSYAEIWKNNIMNSCSEGLKLHIQKINKN